VVLWLRSKGIGVLNVISIQSEIRDPQADHLIKEFFERFKVERYN
jgi:hypothetical protein